MKGIHKIKAEVAQKWMSSGQVHLKILRQTPEGVLIFPETPSCSPLEVGLDFSTKFTAPGTISE